MCRILNPSLDLFHSGGSAAYIYTQEMDWKEGREEGLTNTASVPPRELSMLLLPLSFYPH
jgi:hypothetical protein